MLSFPGRPLLGLKGKTMITDRTLEALRLARQAVRHAMSLIKDDLALTEIGGGDTMPHRRAAANLGSARQGLRASGAILTAARDGKKAAA